MIGGGFPIETYGGSKEIMDLVSSLGNISQAETFAENSVVMKEAIETLKQLKMNKKYIMNCLKKLIL